jgi:hypothetical protein
MEMQELYGCTLGEETRRNSACERQIPRKMQSRKRIEEHA